MLIATDSHARDLSETIRKANYYDQNYERI